QPPLRRDPFSRHHLRTRMHPPSPVWSTLSCHCEARILSVIARPRSGRSNLLAWGSPRPFGARDDRKVSHCEARSLSVIARPRSGRSNLLLTQDDSIGPLATLGTTLMLKFGPFQHDGKNVLRLYSHQQEPHRSVHGDHKRPFKAHVGTPGGFGLEIRGPVPCDRTCVFRGF